MFNITIEPPIPSEMLSTRCNRTMFCRPCKNKSPEWILDGDIKGCFDNISHEWIINNIPMDKTLLKKWPKSGYIETIKLFPTKNSNPQRLHYLYSNMQHDTGWTGINNTPKIL